jgi:hypothetical protein
MSNKAAAWIIAIISIAAALAVFASAGSHNPELYWGYVYIENVIAPSGTILTLESTDTSEVFANQTLPYDPSYSGSYSIMLTFDDSYTPADEGADLNEALTWKVNGITAYSPAAGADTAETGKTNNNFRIDVISTPALSMAIALSSINITLSESIELNVTLNNTGSGDASVTLDSINDTSITSDLPKNTSVVKNSTNYTTVDITPSVCGQQTAELSVNYYNILGELQGTITEPFIFNVEGADLVLSNISISNSNPSEGDTISIISTLLNNGTVNITGFTVYFYYDSTLIGTINSNETMTPNSSIGLSANWEAVVGATTIRITFITTGAECSTANNEISTSVTVSEAEEEAPPAGGGGDWPVIKAQCDDSIDNDGDGLIDYPADPGCSSESDDDETDEIPEEVPPVEEKPAGIAAQFKKALGDALTWFTIKIEKIWIKIFWIMLLVYIILLFIYVPKIVKGRKKKEKDGIKEKIVYTKIKRIEDGPKKEAAAKEKENPIKVIIRPSGKLKAKVDAITRHIKPKPVIPSKHTINKEESSKPAAQDKHVHHRDVQPEPARSPAHAQHEKIQSEPTVPPLPPKQPSIHPQKQVHKGEHSGEKRPSLRQKSIKISSKKDIIDKIKEVHKEND